MTQWEYAVFTVRVPYPGPMSNIDDWPDTTMQTCLLLEMNRLGAEGWEIFDRAHPTLIEPRPGGLFPYNLWARRPAGASPTPHQGEQPGISTWATFTGPWPTAP